MTGLARYFDENPEVKMIVFTGKGGHGKTTCSAALSYYLATVRKKRVLCLSIDFQASLGVIFGKDILDKDEVELVPGLSIVEVDVDKRIKKCQEETKRTILERYKLNKLPKDIEEYIETISSEPATYETVACEAIVELVANKYNIYDMYIFDMPSLYYSIKMIIIAKTLTKWIEKLTEIREKARKYRAIAATFKGEKVKEDSLLNELIMTSDKMKLLINTLMNPKETGFFMILVPERTAILDVERALDVLRQLGIKLSGIIINQVYPIELLNNPGVPNILKYKVKEQQKCLNEIKEKFSKHIVAIIPAFDREPKGLEMLDLVAEHLMYSRIKV